MDTIFAAAIPVVVMLGCLAVPLHILLWVRNWQRTNRRSPLTAKLLRGPGETLRRELEDIEAGFAGYLVALSVLPVMIYAVHVSQSYFGGAPESAFRSTFSGITALGVIVFLSFKLYRLARLRFELQIGLEAEIAMGQELDQLMRKGAIVFHDIPGEDFNVDHVVLTRGGMYAIETKGRMKPDRGRGREDVNVRLESEVLCFPGWQDKSTLAQTRRQARWLAKWTSSAIGEAIQVMPVVALPGWFVVPTDRDDICVISGRQAPKLLNGWQRIKMTDQLMARIAHQLEQRCRDVEPTQYGTRRKFGRTVERSRSNDFSGSR